MDDEQDITLETEPEDIDIPGTLAGIREELETLRTDNERMREQNAKLLQDLRSIVTGKSTEKTPADAETLRADLIKKCRL